MNPKELIILSLINEKPSHAYTLEEKIEQRGMRNWTNIGFSSIYRIITSLEKKGLVKSEIIQEETDARIKKKYTITKKGQDQLRNSVHQALATPTRPRSDFDLGLANIWLLTKDEAITALTHYLESLVKRRDAIFNSWNQAGGKGKIPYLIDALFEHGDIMSKAEMKFAEELIEKIKKHGITNAFND